MGVGGSNTLLTVALKPKVLLAAYGRGGTNQYSHFLKRKMIYEIIGISKTSQGKIKK